MLLLIGFKLLIIKINLNSAVGNGVLGNAPAKAGQHISKSVPHILVFCGDNNGFLIVVITA